MARGNAARLMKFDASMGMSGLHYENTACSESPPCSPVEPDPGDAACESFAKRELGAVCSQSRDGYHHGKGDDLTCLLCGSDTWKQIEQADA